MSLPWHFKDEGICAKGRSGLEFVIDPYYVDGEVSTHVFLSAWRDVPPTRHDPPDVEQVFEEIRPTLADAMQRAFEFDEAEVREQERAEAAACL